MKTNQFILGAVLALTPFVADAKRVHTIGDSTMANYDEGATDTRGWCQYLQQFLAGIEVNNRGKSGSSSKSFYNEAPYWQSVRRQLAEGDIVLIQFSHNDEKNGGMDGDEVKTYYKGIGDDATANATDYRGTTPSGTYKEYLRKYVNETREAGCTPILVGPICRMYFSGNTIRRNGQHDLGDSFSVLTPDGIKEKQSVPATDHSMDYPYQMRLVAEEMNVPYVDLTQGTVELYTSYGQADCMKIISDGDGSTHLSATGAALIARKFVQMCVAQNLLTEYANLTSELGVTPADGNLGDGYKGQTLTREFMVTGFDLDPAAGEVKISAEGAVELSLDGKDGWSKSLSMAYEGGTLIGRFNVRVNLEKDGANEGTVTVTAGSKSAVIPVTANAVSLEGGTEVNLYWRLEKDDSYVLEGPAAAIPQSWAEMEVQRYSNPNANTVWPDYTGFEASRKTQRNLISGGAWPAAEIDEVSTRYIEFGITAMAGTVLNIDEISYYVCGCGGNGMCLKVYYSTEPDFSNPVLIFNRTKMPANNMLDGKMTPVVKLEGGESMRLRFYPWYNGAATGKTLCLSDVRFHGYASDSSAIADVAVTDRVVDTLFYNLQGQRVSAPSRGMLYIAKTLYADGSASVTKTLF